MRTERLSVDLAVGISDLAVLKHLCPYFESGAICNMDVRRLVGMLVHFLVQRMLRKYDKCKIILNEFYLPAIVQFV